MKGYERYAWWVAIAILYVILVFLVSPPANGQPPPPQSQRVAFVNVDPTGSCVDWPNPNAAPLEYNYVSNVLWGCNSGTWAVIGQGGGGGGSGTTNILAKFLSATTIGNSSVSDDGVTTAVTENFSLGTNGLMSAYLNSSSGTVAFTLTKLDNSGNAIQILTTDTSSVYGVCVIGCAPSATSSTALIAVAGQVQCMFDNQTVIRDFVIVSTGVAGDCHDAGSTQPTGVQLIGRVASVNGGAGSTAVIALFSPDTVQAIPPVVTFQVANANPGTVVNNTVKVTGAPSTGTIAAITDTGGVIGICASGCGNSGIATILQSGAALCVFDGATTAGDYVQISSTNAGQCHDTGATYPVPGQVIGRVTSTNGSGGTYGILVFPPESSNPASASIASGTINDIVKYTGTNSIGPSGCTIDSSNNEVCPGSVTTGSGSGKTGYALINGVTSGAQGFSVSDIAGTATLYLIPAAPVNGSFLKDIGSATCPTLPSGAPSACEQLSWASAGTGSVTSIATTSPITGGTITTTGTIACATCLTGTTPTNHAILLGQGTQAVGTVASLGTTTTVLHGNASGDPTFGSVVAGDIGANAVGNAALAVVQTRRTCIIDNDTQSATVLVAAQFSGHCVVPYAATIVEVDVSGGTQTLTGSATAPTFTGTSSIQIGKHGVTNNTALLSGALATASGVACALTSTSGTCIFDNGLTSSNSITISTTSISAGDELYVSAATADGTQTWYNVTIVYTVN